MKLFTSEVQDLFSRKNFEKLRDTFNAFAVFQGKFTFFEIALDGAETNFKFPHGLGFQPKDIIQTSLTGTGTLTWNYALFDATNLNLTTTGACTVRCFVGTYEEGGKV